MAVDDDAQKMIEKQKVAKDLVESRRSATDKTEDIKQFESQTQEALEEIKKKKKKDRKAKKEHGKKSLFTKIFELLIPSMNVKERFGKKDEVYILETKNKQTIMKEVSTNFISDKNIQYLILMKKYLQLIMIRRFLKFDLDSKNLDVIDMRATRKRVDPGEMSFLD